MKATKDEVRYREGIREINCSRCDMFSRPDACSAVRGEIRPQDLCNLFSMVEGYQSVPRLFGAA